MCKPHAALFGVFAYALSLDVHLLDLMVMGAESVGVLDPLGPWQSAPFSDGYVDFDQLDHAEWNEWLMRNIEERGAAASGDERARADATWAKTLREEQGFIRRTSVEELNARFGASGWRAIRRFGVRQHGEVRACEHAAESGHNAATGVSERLSCEAADLPLRIAAYFAKQLGDEKFTMQPAPTTSRRRTAASLWPRHSSRSSPCGTESAACSSSCMGSTSGLYRR